MDKRLRRDEVFTDETKLGGISKRIAEKADEELRNRIHEAIENFRQAVRYVPRIQLCELGKECFTTDFSNPWTYPEESQIPRYWMVGDEFLKRLETILFERDQRGNREQAFDDFVKRFGEFEQELLMGREDPESEKD
jgi:hypothetical protein